MTEICLACGEAPSEPAPSDCYPGLVDPCVGVLPDVRQACCGHGDPAKAYVVFTPIDREDMVVLRGDNALAVFRLARALRG